MLRFGAVALLASLTMATAAMAAENPAPPASFELGAKACPAAGIGTPAPIFTTSCFACGSTNFTGPTLTASDVDCTTATSDLQTAVRHAATTDCQSHGYDNFCFPGNGSAGVVLHVTSACSTSRSGTTVSGYATYYCQFYNC